jgi:hypothetical protein
MGGQAGTCEGKLMDDDLTHYMKAVSEQKRQINQARLSLLHASAEAESLSHSVKGVYNTTLVYELRKSIRETQVILNG